MRVDREVYKSPTIFKIFKVVATSFCKTFWLIFFSELIRINISYNHLLTNIKHTVNVLKFQTLVVC